MIDDLNLEFEDHDRGRGRRRRTERDDRAATTGFERSGWTASPSQPPWGGVPRQAAGPGSADPRAPWVRGDSQPGYNTGGYDTGGYGRDPRYDSGIDARHQDPRYGDPRYDTGGQPRYDTGGQPRYDDPRYADPRYDTSQRRYQPEPPYQPGPPQREFDPRYDTGARAYGRLAADDRYDTGQQRRGFLEEGYDEDGGLLPGYADDEPPRRSRGKAKKKRRRGRSFLALFLTLLLLGGLAGGGYLAYDKITGYFLTPDYDGAGTAETVQIEVKQGQLLGDIATTLVQADVVKSYKAFVSAAEKNKNAVNIQPGFYTMHKQMSGEAAVLALLDTKNRNVKGITIPEGMITIQIYDLLSQKLKIPVADFKAAADPKKLGIPDWWFKRQDGKKVAGGVEGFLFPATYEFPPNATAQQALKIMTDHFLTVTGGMKFAENAQKLGISPYEALVAASIGQAEAVKPVDYPKVARALYNRVYKDGFDCKCLQIDSAVNYWLRITGKVPKDSSQILRGEQHNRADPYNTFDVPGMPIGPISNPGELALKGAIAPAAGPWTYFMTIDKAGTMGYATTWAGHCANYATAVKNGILTGTCNG
jgi:peptidoglycan lytic transglycosylase G